MRGALMDATLPVVTRRTCVCPSRLLAAAVNCPPVMATGTGKWKWGLLNCSVYTLGPDQHELPDRT
jgi:hypothetical protein